MLGGPVTMQQLQKLGNMNLNTLLPLEVDGSRKRFTDSTQEMEALRFL